MIASNLGVLAIALVCVGTGVLMLGYAFRGVPSRPTVGMAHTGDVVLVAKKRVKKSKGDA